MIHFAICDDEPAQARLLSQLVSGWCAGQGEACQITCYPSAEALLFAWEDEPSADILLLDILMGQMNGMELARRLRQRRERLQILFITGTPDFVFAGYGVEAVSYLMKPVKEEELFRCLALAQSRLARQEPEVLVEAGDVCRRVPLAEISYLESFGHTTVLHTTRGDLESRKGIQAWEDALVGGGFFRLHRSYLICLDHVAAITKTAVEMDSGIRLPIGNGRPSTGLAWTGSEAGRPAIHFHTYRRDCIRWNPCSVHFYALGCTATTSGPWETWPGALSRTWLQRFWACCS